MFIQDNSACQDASGLPANAFLPASLLLGVNESVPQSAPSRSLASVVSDAFDRAIAAYNEGRINDPAAYASLGPNIVADVRNTNARGAGGPVSPAVAGAGAGGNGGNGRGGGGGNGATVSGSGAEAVCVVPADPVEVSPLRGTAPNRARPSLRTDQGLLPSSPSPAGLAGFGGALTVVPYSVTCETAEGKAAGGISPWWWVLAAGIVAVALSNGKGRR